MARISMVALEDWDPGLRDLTAAEGQTELERGILRMLAHKPQAAIAFVALQRAIAATTELDARLRELVRLRIAFHNQCRSCMAVRYPEAIRAGLDESAVCSLDKPQEAADLSASEKAAIAFADTFATDHMSIGDADYQALRGHFTESQIVELGLVCALCVGIGRLAMSWNMVDELPEAFRTGKTGTVTPSQGEPVLVMRRRLPTTAL